MSTSINKPATGPIILEQLLQLREELREMREVQDRRDLQFRHISEQIDRFLAAEIDLTGTLVSVREVVGNSRDSMEQLRQAATELKRTIDGVLDLKVGDPSNGRAREKAA